jgi:hypothetical protein
MPGSQQIGGTLRLGVSGRPRRFELPAFPQAQAVGCRIAPVLFRPRDGGAQVFVLGAGQTIAVQFTVARRPQRWSARFSSWQQLSERFDPLKAVLRASGALTVRADQPPRPFADDAYDDVDDGPSILAKASLLNLYAKLTDLKEPIGDRIDWFSFVLRILRIGRERLIAVADPALGDIVNTVRDNSAAFRGEYAKADASQHFKNFPPEFRVTFAPSRMLSIKSEEALGNIQLTIAPAKDAAGGPVLLLDADIDENGNLLKHFFDVLKHRFTGGTHPFDIHELLLFSNRELDLGYSLRPTEAALSAGA